jgi:hypothetical protein
MAYRGKMKSKKLRGEQSKKLRGEHAVQNYSE